jgi:WD40 repeat protein
MSKTSTVTALNYNHNGSLVLAGSTDGMIRVFGIFSLPLFFIYLSTRYNIWSTLTWSSSRSVQSHLFLRFFPPPPLFLFMILPDMKTCAAIAGWQAHSHEVAAVQFSADETSVFSVGKDNKVCTGDHTITLSHALTRLPRPPTLSHALTRSHTLSHIHTTHAHAHTN